jgi:hypothetical protein
MVVHLFNHRYLGDGGRRIIVQGQLTQKQKTLSEKQTKSKTEKEKDWE